MSALNRIRALKKITVQRATRMSDMISACKSFASHFDCSQSIRCSWTDSTAAVQESCDHFRAASALSFQMDG